MHNPFRTAGAALGFLFIFACDQTSKFFVAWFWPTSLQLNQGISFGWLAFDRPFFLSLFLGCAVVGSVVLFWQRWREWPCIAGVFVGGAVSNIVDRLVWGGVRDWLFVPVFQVKNNLADWACVLSLAVILWAEIRNQQGRGV